MWNNFRYYIIIKGIMEIIYKFKMKYSFVLGEGFFREGICLKLKLNFIN